MNICQNGGTCLAIDGVDKAMKCESPNWFSGFFCEINNNPCTPGVCGEHGMCSVQDNHQPKCQCDRRWLGTTVNTPTFVLVKTLAEDMDSVR